MSTKRVLTRNLRVGETLTFDNGRIVVRLEERTGRSSARIRCELGDDVRVNKPGEPQDARRTLLDLPVKV